MIWSSKIRSVLVVLVVLPVFKVALTPATALRDSLSNSDDGTGSRALLQTVISGSEGGGVTMGSGGSAGNVSAAALGAWANGTNFSVPVTAQGFRFGTHGEAVTLSNNYCGYGPLTSPYVVGISPNSPLATRRPSSGCGTCLEAICAEGSDACLHPEAASLLAPPASSQPSAGSIGVVSPGRLLLRVVDICNSCDPLDLNLHADAFAELADPRIGIMNITYRYVTCPWEGRNISIYVSAFRPTQGGWIRLSVRDVAGNGLAAVAIAHCPRPQAAANETAGRKAGAGAAAGITDNNAGGLTPGCEGTLRGPSWRDMKNTVGAQFEYNGLPKLLPYDLRLTDVDGREIIVWNAIMDDTAPKLYLTQTQFPPLTQPAEGSGGIGTRP